MRHLSNVITGFTKKHPVIYLIYKLFLGFILADALLLMATRWLGVSYGPIHHLQFLSFLTRIGIFVAWGFFALVLRKINPVASLCLTLIPNLLLSGLLLYGFYIEPFQISTTRITVPVPDLTRPLRLVQISDIHVERTTPRERKLPGKIDALQPDIIVVTGDIINESYVNSPQTHAAITRLFSDLRAPDGVYAVNGNVESADELKELLTGTHVQALDDVILPLPGTDGRLVFMGLSYINWAADQERLQDLARQIMPDQTTILLYHKPDLAYSARDLGIDLYLAGHTHGGQVRLPFYGALFTNSRYGKTFEMGLYPLNEMTLFVSRGLGFTGGIAPRIRFLAPPEVVVIDLVPAPPSLTK